MHVVIVAIVSSSLLSQGTKSNNNAFELEKVDLSLASPFRCLPCAPLELCAVVAGTYTHTHPPAFTRDEYRTETEIFMKNSFRRLPRTFDSIRFLCSFSASLFFTSDDYFSFEV